MVRDIIIEKTFTLRSGSYCLFGIPLFHLNGYLWGKFKGSNGETFSLNLRIESSLY